MASLTRWTWAWASSRSWWWTGKPGVLQSMRLQRPNELNWTIQRMHSALFEVWTVVNVRVCDHLFNEYYKVKLNIHESVSQSVRKLVSRVWLFIIPWTIAHQAHLSMEFSGKNTVGGCHFFLHRIFPTQGLNLGLPHCRQIIYHLSHQGGPRYTCWMSKWKNLWWNEMWARLYIILICLSNHLLKDIQCCIIKMLGPMARCQEPCPRVQQIWHNILVFLTTSWVTLGNSFSHTSLIFFLVSKIKTL